MSSRLSKKQTKLSILVTGGAGYIGSHTVKALIKKGHNVVVFDNLSTGKRRLLHPYAKLIIGDILDKNAIKKTLKENKIDAVFHFAGLISMGESYKKPKKYYRVNLEGSKNLLQAMIESEVKKIVFSSSAGVYGNAKIIPIPEDHPKNPVNPYGETKWKFEQILSKTKGINYVALRYFNAAGADPEAEIGEMHDPETHLIPIILDVALGKREYIEIFGNDYETKDGTCIRDYVHVSDLVDAHILALEYLIRGGKNTAFNLGSQHGFSNLEVVGAVQKITKRHIPIKIGLRRKGDSTVLIADSEKAKIELGWKPKMSDIKTIVRTAWEWHKKAR